MTRYEKLKPGMEFLHGSIKTIDDAVDISCDFIECWYCPFKTSCHIGIIGAPECEDRIRAYLEEEIE